MDNRLECLSLQTQSWVNPPDKVSVLWSEDPFRRAEREPGTWIVVYDLEKIELLALLFGAQVQPWRPPQVIRFDSANDHFFSRSLSSMPDEFRTVHRPTWGTWWVCLWHMLRRTPKPIPSGGRLLPFFGYGCIVRREEEVAMYIIEAQGTETFGVLCRLLDERQLRYTKNAATRFVILHAEIDEVLRAELTRLYCSVTRV